MFINVKRYPYNAVGDGVSDDTLAIKRAIVDASKDHNPGTIFLPRGTYRVTERMTVKVNVNIIGEGDLSIILQTNPIFNPLYIQGVQGVHFKDFKVMQSIDYTNLANRNASGHLIWLLDSVGIVIDNVSGETSPATFVTMQRVSDTTITNCYYKNTLADGIHITDKCKRVTIIGNHSDNAGDDSISVVSYVNDADYCEDITIEGNSILNGRSRGIAIIGGKRTGVVNNRINGTASSGILTNKDASGTLGTYEAVDTTLIGNHIQRAGAIIKANTGNKFGIELSWGTVGVIAKGNTVIGGNVEMLKGFTVNGTTDVTLEGNVVRGVQQSGFVIDGATDLIFNGNRGKANKEFGALITNTNLSTFNGNVMSGNGNVDQFAFDNCKNSRGSANIVNSSGVFKSPVVRSNCVNVSVN